MSNQFMSFCVGAQEDLAAALSDDGHALIRQAAALEPHWHPNGFVVFELGEVARGRLRLHLWPDSDRHLRDEVEHVHTHPWDLCSKVLIGTYRERMLEPTHSTALDALAFSKARIDYALDRNTLRPTGREFLRPTHVVTASAGEFHEVPAGTAHQTLIPKNEFVATLLVTSPLRRDDVTVYTTGPLPAPNHVREPVSVSMRAQLLGRLTEALLP